MTFVMPLKMALPNPLKDAMAATTVGRATAGVASTAAIALQLKMRTQNGQCGSRIGQK